MGSHENGNAVAAPERKVVSFPQLLQKNEARLRNLLPDYMSPERYLSLAMLAVNKDARLRAAAKEAPETVVDSVLRAAQCGFELGGPVPGAHLVAFRNKGRMECQMIPDYRGLINLAVEAGAILAGDARVVYQGEHLQVLYGTEDKIVHHPDFDAIDKGDVVAVYFVAELPNGRKKFEVMTKKQVDQIRARSKASDNGPWVSDYSEMAKKTVTKRGLKYVPMSPNNASARRLALAIEADNRVESGKAGAIVPEWDSETTASEQVAERTRERMEGLRERINAGRDVTAKSEQHGAWPAPEPEPEGSQEKGEREHLNAKYHARASEIFATPEGRKDWQRRIVGKASWRSWTEDDYLRAIAALDRGEGLAGSEEPAGVAAGSPEDPDDDSDMPF